MNGLLVLLGATLSAVTVAGPEPTEQHVPEYLRRFTRHGRGYSRREPEIRKLLPIRYDGYRYGYTPVSDSESHISQESEYPSRYGEHSIGDSYNEGKGQYKGKYDIEYLEEEITKAFFDRRNYGNSRRGYGDRQREYYGRDGEHQSGHSGGHTTGNEHAGSSGSSGSQSSGGHASGGGHTESSGGHASGGGHTESSGGHANIDFHPNSLEKGEIFSGVSIPGRVEISGLTSGGGHSERDVAGGHGTGGGHQESSGLHKSEHGTEQQTGIGKQLHETQSEHIGTENSRYENRFRDRYRDHHEDRYRDHHEDRYRDRYEDRHRFRYGDIEEDHLLRDRLPYGSEHGALIGGFIHAGQHKDYKGSYDHHEDSYGREGLEKGLGFFAHRDTSDEHLQLKSYYLKGDSPESYEYEYSPYRSYRPYGYRRRYEHSSEESKEYIGYKGIYFGSKERTGFIRDFVKSKGSEEKSKSKSDEKSKSKSKSKSDDKSKGITDEYKKFVKDILKDLEKGLGIKAKSKGDDKGDKGDKGKDDKSKGEEKGKGNKNGLFGGDLVNVIKVTFGHEEKKKAEKKSDRRRRSITGYARKFVDPRDIRYY